MAKSILRVSRTNYKRMTTYPGAHERGEDHIGFSSILHHQLLQKPLFRIHCRFPKLQRHHLSQTCISISGSVNKRSASKQELSPRLTEWNQTEMQRRNPIVALMYIIMPLIAAFTISFLTFKSLNVVGCIRREGILKLVKFCLIVAIVNLLPPLNLTFQ